MNVWIEEVKNYLAKKVEELKNQEQTEEVKQALAFIESMKGVVSPFAFFNSTTLPRIFAISFEVSKVSSSPIWQYRSKALFE